MRQAAALGLSVMVPLTRGDWGFLPATASPKCYYEAWILEDVLQQKDPQKQQQSLRILSTCQDLPDYGHVGLNLLTSSKLIVDQFSLSLKFTMLSKVLPLGPQTLWFLSMSWGKYDNTFMHLGTTIFHDLAISMRELCKVLFGAKVTRKPCVNLLQVCGCQWDWSSWQGRLCSVPLHQSTYPWHSPVPARERTQKSSTDLLQQGLKSRKTTMFFGKRWCPHKPAHKIEFLNGFFV